MLKIEPKSVFDWFYKINQIPRCSGNEKEISNFLVDFAKKRNLEVEQDDNYNVIIRKKASPGYEKSIPVIIQGHMDMVCVKSEESTHNFETDPIEMIVEGDFVKANNTTLGADDGIAVAMALALLDENHIHPDLEVLITTNEEAGMFGAAAIKEGVLKGKRLINIDSEEEGIFLVSCSGGSTINTLFDINKVKIKSTTGIQIIVSDLKGGHSGMEIDKQRANSNKILFRILNELKDNMSLNIAKVQGGTKHNAIPNKSVAEIIVSDNQKALKIIEEFGDELKKEYLTQDPKLQISTKEIIVEEIFDEKLTENLIDYFMLVPDGVIKVSKDIKELVQTSVNNAVIEEIDDKIQITTSIRSSVESQLNEMINIFKIIAKKTNSTVNCFSRYPAWEYEPKSVLRDKISQTYKMLFDDIPKYSAVHAGLECGLLKKVLPDCDMISYGPNIYDVHSPSERLSISSSQRIWKFTLELLKNLE